MGMRNRAGWILGLSMTTGAGWAQVDYPEATWYPAASVNFATSNRPTSYPITHVVIHIMEGYYNGSISWFQNPASRVSAHYLTRSSDGTVAQMVREKDLAYHAGVSFYNQQAVGIEHEGFSSNPGLWYTDAQYASSARLTRYLTAKYNIPRTRTYIIGHNETGRATSCPGPWDWTKYMAMVRNSAALVGSTVPIYIQPNATFQVTLTFLNQGDDNWAGAGSDPCRLGTVGASPYWVSGEWVSDQIIGGPTTTTIPNANGTFTFNMRAPASNGTYTQDFQLRRGSIGPFGPIVPITFRVGPTEKVIDNTDPGFSVTGTWSTSTSGTGRIGADFRNRAVTPKSEATATWALDAPAEGFYDIYANWVSGSNRQKNALFELVDRRENIPVFVDMTQNGGTWNKLGRVYLRQGGGRVHLRSFGNSSGQVIADAIKIEGPYPGL